MTNAGGKARADMNRILAEWGASPLVVEAIPDRDNLGSTKKAMVHAETYRSWRKALATVPDGSVLIVQVPSTAHTVFFSRVVRLCKKRGIRLVVIVHDLDTFRMALTPGASRKNRIRTGLEEKALVQGADVLVLHNESMRDVAESAFEIDPDGLVTLGIFDYLVEDGHTSGKDRDADGPVVVAGNLSEEKAGYLYHLPADVPFALYGVGYGWSEPQENMEYRGVFPAGDLPHVLSGSFGLVWDGPRADTCAGEYGEYLKINNPHKASLYLASGMPIVTWSQAALASFVCEHACGILVDSLDDLHDVIADVTPEDYGRMVRNADAVGNQLRAGYYTQRALDVVRTILDARNA